MRRYFIKTYGCQMNKGDSARLAGILEASGYTECQNDIDADIILINTCVVRKNAEDKAAWYIQSAKFHQKKRPNMIIGVCGCIVTEPGRNMAKDFPHVDVFIPPGQPEMLAEFLGFEKAESREQKAELRGKGDGITYWLPIMEGCDNFCSYCIVPYVRGREKSRPVDEILEEIGKIDFNQYKEIYLLGQNVNSYKFGFAELLRKISFFITHYALPVTRIRFMSSHPKDMSQEIIDTVAELPQVCEYFHLPIQHGDDEILKLMNRGYTVDDYRKIVEKIRARMPEAAITSDIIVGYPGETDKQFNNSLSVIRKFAFDAVNTAIYSVRPGTAASKLIDDVPDSVKQDRLQQIMEVVDEVVLARNEKLVGTGQGLLVESFEDGYYKGRTRTNKIVKFASSRNGLIGKLVDVKIKSAQSWILEGEVN